MLFYLFSAYALKQHILLPCFLCFLHYLSVTVTRSWVKGGPDWRDGDNRVPLVGSFFPNISQCKCGSRKLQVQQHLETSSPPMNPDLYTQTPGPRHLSFLLYAFLISLIVYLSFSLPLPWLPDLHQPHGLKEKVGSWHLDLTMSSHCSSGTVGSLLPLTVFFLPALPEVIAWSHVSEKSLHFEF